MGKKGTPMPDSFLSSTRQAGALVALIATCVIALISTGQIQVPLPAPATGKAVNLVPDDVLPWRPQPLEGSFAPNTRLHDAVRLFEGKVVGAESVAISANGNLALLDRYGSLFEAAVSTQADSSSSSWQLQEQPIVRLGAGRPLGYHFDHDGNLIVCDSLKGLVKYDYTTKDISILATHVSQMSQIDPGSEITYANDLAIASDGKIYFTSCTDIIPAVNKAGYYDTFRAWMLGLAQGLPKGRLLRYDPETKETVVIAKGFYYANGVALSPDESYIVLAETDRIRLLKVWIKGPKAGSVEPLIERLPGPPDGVSTAPDGNFWVGLVSPVPPIARLLRDPTVRALYAWLPDSLRPPLKKWGAVAKVSGESGAVVDWLMDPTGTHISSVSAAVEHDGKLFMGNLAGDYVSYIDLELSKHQEAQRQQNGQAQQRKSSGFVAFAEAAEVQQDLESCTADSPHGACAGAEGGSAENDDNDNDDKDVIPPENDKSNNQGSGQGSVEGTCKFKPRPADGPMPDDDRALLYIHGKVHHNKVVMFSKSYCPFCRKAKRALGKFLQPDQYVVVELDLLHELPESDEGRTIPAEAFQDALERVTGKRSVPRVFIGGKFVGGGDDMDSMAQTGRLKSVLEEQGLVAKS